jgi:ectoine hydroxylase-related dioxygenase (phytanoyl-CoA dioxygenase family)
VNVDFRTMVDQAITKCKTLSESDARHFVAHGWVVVKEAVPKQKAEDIVACAWRELEERGIKKGDPETWKKEPYIRTGCPPDVSIMASRGDKEAAKQKLETRTRYGLPPESPLLQDVAPRALGAQVDCVGGRERVAAPEQIALPDSLAVNLCSDDSKLGEEGWRSTRAPGWHKDGWHYRHFLDSPQQGLLLAYIYSDLSPESGGTQMCVDSVGVVARLLARHPEGIHPDTVYSYIKPYMVRECSEFQELTGEAGDLAIMHPYMVHRVAGNASGRVRFGQFPSLKLSQPMRFSREDPGDYSLSELVVLKELGQLTHLDFAAEADYTKYPREDITPPPSRTEEEKQAIETELYDEQQRMGLTEPQWAQEMWPKRERP